MHKDKNLVILSAVYEWLSSLFQQFSSQENSTNASNMTNLNKIKVVILGSARVGKSGKKRYLLDFFRYYVTFD